MKRILFFVLLMVCSVSSAEWVSAGPTSDGSAAIYFDNISMQRNGSTAKLMWIKNFLSVQTTRKGKKYKSVQFVTVYDCKLKLSKTPSIVFYAGSMGEGEAVISSISQEEKEEFTPILPDSENEAIWKIACNNPAREGGNASQERQAKKPIKLFVAGPNEGNEAGASIYFDSNSLAGNFPDKKFTLLIDYPAPLVVEKYMMNSALMKMEMNCSESSTRVVKIELMAGAMGAGDLIKVVDGDTWRKIPPNFYMLPDLVCAK